MILLMDFCPRAGERRAREGRTLLPCPSTSGDKRLGVIWFFTWLMTAVQGGVAALQSLLTEVGLVGPDLCSECRIFQHQAIAVWKRYL